MAFPDTPLDFVVELALGANLVEASSFWTWTDITQWVLKSATAGGGITITRGRDDESATAAPQECTLTLNNAGGRFCPRNPTGPYFGRLQRATPLRVRVNNGGGYVTVFSGFVEEWPPRYAPGLVFQWVPVTAFGVTRRLARAGTTVQSAFRRTLSLQSPLVYGAYAYWPMEDERDSGVFVSGMTQQAVKPPMTYFDMDAAADSQIDGSLPLPRSGDGAYFVGPVDFTDNPGWIADHKIGVRWVMRIPESPSTTTGVMAWATPGCQIAAWYLYLVPGTPDRLQLVGRNAAGTDLVVDTGLDFAISSLELSDGRQLWFEVDIEYDEVANTDWTYTVYTSSGSITRSGTVAGVGAGDDWKVQTVFYSTYPNNSGGWTVGHIAVCNTGSLYGYGLGAYGATGFGGETTEDRFLRLTTDRNIEASSGASDTRMGPQQTAGLLDMLRDCEIAEGGVLVEGRDGALVLQTRDDRYDTAVALALDNNQGHIAEPFEPQYDDQQIRNSVEVSAVGGASGEYIDQVSIADHNGAVYEDRIDANLHRDEDLVSHASFRSALGGGEDLRYPQITLKLHGTPELIDDWLASDIGSRVTISNPPAGLPPDLIDLLIEGYTETLDIKEWTVTLNTSPALPWQAIVLDDVDARVDGGGYQYVAGSGLSYHGSQLVFAATATQTTLVVDRAVSDDGDELKWLGSAVPFDIVVAGERMTVTAVTDNPITFVAAGTAATAVNASVSPALPAGAVAGDLLLIWAAIRNDPTGFPDLPAGYNQVAGFGSTGLFARIMQTGDAAPTVTFTGGAAGDDTIAQMAAFRHAHQSATFVESQANTGVQNIAYPGAIIRRNNQLVIVAGWKRDDWTSVATIAGMAEIGEPDSTAGNDAGVVWDYQIQTTATDIAAGSFTVTGGAVADSLSTIATFPGSRQTLTVVRGVNGVRKAHVAGAPLNLYRARVVAL